MLEVSQQLIFRQKNIKMASYLGHLDHIWKLCQTGNGDHIVVGFHLGPDEAIK